VGYAIAPTDVALSIRKAIAPFSVTDVAQAAAVASLGVEKELAERVEAIVTERVRVLAALREQGWEVPDSQANFVWLPLGPDALDFAAACDPVSVRPFAGDGVRVSIGDPDVNDRFLAVAAQWRG
jgi:histidinol-phosphate aminotransferase